MQEELGLLMVRQGGAVTARQTYEHGLTKPEVEARLRRGDLRIVRQGVYTTTSLWEAADDAERHRIQVAAALLNRRWRPGVPTTLAAGFNSARILWRLPEPESAGRALRAISAEPHHDSIQLVSATRCQRTCRAGVDVRPGALPGDQIAYVDGVPVTSLARTAVDLARELTWWNAVIMNDAALRAGVPRDELIRVAAHCARWPGGRQAVRAAEFADGAAESPLESIARAVCADHGLPAPELQVWLRGACGRNFRVDMYFREQNTIFEPDGKMKYKLPDRDPADVLWDEKVREDSLRDAGYQFVRGTHHQVTTEPGKVVARLQVAFGSSLHRPA
jgi:hypothetical protein